MTWRAWLDRELAQIRARDQWRGLRTFDAAGPEGRLGPDSQPVVSFASNDYLGLSAHPDVAAAAHAALDRWGSGSGASRLVVGTRPVHVELEAELARWKGAEAALLFPTGYSANVGVLSALRSADVTLFSDELNHASIVDGCRLARARVVVFPHRDVDELGRLLRRSAGRAVVVSETVFSMDGDVAPLGALIDACIERQALLILDEAHAVLGPHLRLEATGNGSGQTPDGQVAIPAALDVILVGTLSKALGSLGGFVAASRRWVEWLVNRARPFIFTTAPTPADAAAALAALHILRSSPGAKLIAQLRSHIDLLCPGRGSPIIPVMLGSERRALESAHALLEKGLLVPAIRPPTVPPGTSRLRIAVSAVHTEEQLSLLSGVLDDLGLRSLVCPCL